MIFTPGDLKQIGVGMLGGYSIGAAFQSTAWSLPWAVSIVAFGVAAFFYFEIAEEL